MELKKVWMSPDTAGKSRCGLRTLGGIAAIPVLMLLLTAGGVFLSFYWALPRAAFSLILVFGVTALGVALALRVGWRSVGDATVFFLTEDDRLFLLDARGLVGPSRNVLDYAADAMKTQALLRRLARQPHVPTQAEEILRVASIRENGGYYAIRCETRRPNSKAALCTRFLVKGLEDEELLLRHLERRKSWADALEARENRNPFRILVSALLLAACAALCVLSHPAVGTLPQAVYFPCLGAAFVAFCFLVFFLIRLRRGE